MNEYLGGLDLGYVTDITFEHVSREGDIDHPYARGTGRQDLGSLATPIRLAGVLTGSGRFDGLDAFHRHRMIGDSLKLDCDMLKTVAYISRVGLLRQRPRALDYELTLRESLFKQVNACDATADWSVDSGGGSLSAISSGPSPKEGSAALKLVTTTPGAGVFGTLKYNPSALIDINDYAWVALWFRTNNITNMTDIEVVAYRDASNYALYDFVGEVAAVDTWYRLRARKADFSVTGSMEWDEVDYILVRERHSTDQSFTFIIDDLGAYE